MRPGTVLLDEWGGADLLLTTEPRWGLCDAEDAPTEDTPLLPRAERRASVRRDSVTLAALMAPAAAKGAAPSRNAVIVAVLGTAAALVSAGLNWTVNTLVQAKGALPLYTECAWRTAWALLAVCVTNCVPSAAAGGSGIPQVRALLQGVSVEAFFRMSTLVAKLSGLACAILAGFPIGSEGPFMHATAIVAVQCLRCCPAESTTAALDIVTAACASGVAANFGAPLAGVVFAIELAHSYYRLPSLLLSVAASVAGALALRAVRLSAQAALFSTDLNSMDTVTTLGVTELFLVVSVGLVSGVCASGFVALMSAVLKLRDRRYFFPGIPRRQWWRRALLAGAAVAVLQCVITDELQLTTTTEGHRAPLTDLFSVRGATPGRIPTMRLVRFFFARLAVCPIAAVLPVPCGVALPCFEMGAALGRIVAHASALWISCGVDCAVRLSLAGGAAFCAAATHTLSPGLLVLELTGQGNETANVFAAVVIALAVSKRLTASVFDVIQDVCSVPAMPVGLPRTLRHKQVSDIVSHDWVSLKCSALEGAPAHTQIVIGSRGQCAVAAGKEVGVRLAVKVAEEFGLHSIPLTCAARGTNALMGAVDAEQVRQSLDTGLPIPDREVDWSPLTVGLDATLDRVARLFSALNPACVFVVSKGELVGVLSKLQWIREVNGAAVKASIAAGAWVRVRNALRSRPAAS